MKIKNKISRREFLKKSVQGTALLGIGSGSLLIQGCSKQKVYDVIISGGLVFDGLGNPGREIDIAIKGNNFYLLQKNLDKRKANLVIEAKGFAVAPGFIDAHSHTGVELLINPKAESQVRQGVTTEISGNCGYSVFPIPDVVYEERRKYLKDGYNYDLDWRDISGFFSRLRNKGIAINHATLVGHGNLRGEVIGYNDRPPTERELLKMTKNLASNLKLGALGLSTGLIYPPGSYSNTSEIIELCRVVAKQGGIYSTHMRSEEDKVLSAIDEALEIARQTNVSLQISHLKVANPANWSKIDQVISKIETAKKKGIKILADRYPYIAGSNNLSSIFPLWAQQGTTAEFIDRLKDQVLDSRLRKFVNQQDKKRGSWDKILISSVFTEKNKMFEGKNILEASQIQGKKPYDFIRDLLIEENNRVGQVVFYGSEDNLKRILSHPLVVAGADGAAVAPYGVLGKGKPHPRLYGTFARFIGKYAREEKIFSIAAAIQKMTSMTAKKFGLNNRGQVNPGFRADAVIFDPDTIIDRSTWKQPHQYPDGVKYVIVNGKVVIQQGEHTGQLPGTIIT